jgi:hypothetical protein
MRIQVSKSLLSMDFERCLCYVMCKARVYGPGRQTGPDQRGMVRVSKRNMQSKRAKRRRTRRKNRREDQLVRGRESKRFPDQCGPGIGEIQMEISCAPSAASAARNAKATWHRAPTVRPKRQLPHLPTQTSTKQGQVR